MSPPRAGPTATERFARFSLGLDRALLREADEERGG